MVVALDAELLFLFVEYKKKNIYYIIASNSKIHILFQLMSPPYIFLNRKKNMYLSEV